jgi:hypothetical protein
MKAIVPERFDHYISNGLPVGTFRFVLIFFASKPTSYFEIPSEKIEQ